MGEDVQTGPLLSTQTPTMVRLAWAKPLLPAALQLLIEQVVESPCKGNQHVQNGVQGGTQGAQGSNSLQCYRCQGWGHMARECATLAAPLIREGGT